MSCSAIKTEGKEEERRIFMVMMFVFPNNCYAEVLLLKEWLSAC